jgi:hypothetical protein
MESNINSSVHSFNNKFFFGGGGATAEGFSALYTVKFFGLFHGYSFFKKKMVLASG